MVLHIIPSVASSSGGPKRSLENILSIRPDDKIFSLSNKSLTSLPTISLLEAISGIVSRRYSACHIHSIWNPLLAIFAIFCRWNNVKLVLSPRGMLEPWVLERSSLKKKIAMFTYVRALFHDRTLIVVSSLQEKLNILKIWPAKDIKIISNGYSGEIFERSSIDDGVLSLVYFGRIDKKKGIDVLIQSVESLGIDYVLRIVGCEDGDCHGLDISSDKIKIYPFMGQDDLSEILVKSHVFVFPTKSENFGNTILESLAHGLFVITTKESSWWMLTKNNGGVIVDNSVVAFKEAIMDYASLSNAQRLKLSKNACNHARLHLMNNLADEWKATYE